MDHKYEDSKFKQWLDSLQQESWQLELIISGVAIFGLISSFDPFLEFFASLSMKIQDMLYLQILVSMGFSVIILSLYALTFCLILHIILRGLWIGAIGLRYFSGDIDYKSLKYTDRFTNYLKNKIGSFDKYIGKLEDFCSLIFAVSFLLVFFFISFFLSLGVGAIPFYFIEEFMGDTSGRIVAIVLIFIMGFAYLVTFIDFFTQGFFKKKKWLGFFYFPLYKVMSRVTFSFIYRPLLYNLLDNRYGKKVFLFMVPAFFIAIWAVGHRVSESNFHLEKWRDNPEYLNTNNYYDQIENDEKVYVNAITIPSKTMTTSYLPIFIKHRGAIEDVAIAIDSTLQPQEDLRGLVSTNAINITTSILKDSIEYSRVQRYLNVLDQEVLSVQIDSIDVNASWLFSKNSKYQLGYETVIDLKNFKRGEHILNVQRKSLRNDSIITLQVGIIPFWYYPD